MTIQGPRIATHWILTGTVRHRYGWFGRLILQVEESRQCGNATPFDPQQYDQTETRWRDATGRDLLRVQNAYLQSK